MNQSMITRKTATATILKRISDALHPDSPVLKPSNKQNSPSKHITESISNYKQQTPFQLQVETSEFKLDPKKDRDYYMSKLVDCQNALRKKAKKNSQLLNELASCQQKVNDLSEQFQKKSNENIEQFKEIQILKQEIENIKTNDNKKLEEKEEIFFHFQTLEKQIQSVKQQHQTQIDQLLSQLKLSTQSKQILQKQVDRIKIDSETLEALNNHLNQFQYLFQQTKSINSQEFYLGINYILGKQLTIFNHTHFSTTITDITQKNEFLEQVLKQAEVQNQNKSFIITNLQQNLFHCQRSLNETSNKLLKVQELLLQANSAVFSHQTIATNAINQKNTVFQELNEQQQRIQCQSKNLSIQLQYFLGKYFDSDVSYDEQDVLKLEIFLFRVFLNKVIETNHLPSTVSTQLQQLNHQKSIVLTQIKQYYRQQLEQQIVNSLSYYKSSIKRK